MPEKKADKTNDIPIMMMEVSNIIADYPAFVSQSVYGSFAERQTSRPRPPQKI